MAIVRNLMVRAGADFSALRRETQRASQQLVSFRNSVSGTMKGIAAALAAVGIGTVIKDAVQSAMTVEASIQQINRIMGQNSAQFMQWANDQAQAFGMAKSEALKYGAVYGNLISGFTKSTGETTQYTEELLKASAVVASATGRTMNDVMERIRSGLLGNTEAIEDLGINVNVAMIQSTEAFRRFANGKSWQQLDFQTQQQIRLFAILEQSAKKYGDNLFNNTNSAQLMFVAQLKNLQLSLGQAFLPIYSAVLPALTSFVTYLANAMNVVAQFTQALFGSSVSGQQQQAKATTQQAKAVSGLGDAYKDAGAKAKKAQGSVAGFDEVNTLGSGAESGAGNTGADGIGVPGGSSVPNEGIGEPSDGISPKVQAMANRVKEAFRSMSEAVKIHKDEIIAALAGLAVGFATFAIVSNWGAIVGGIRTAFTSLGAVIGGVISPIVAVAAIIAALVAAIIYFYRTNETFRGVVDGIFNAISMAALWLWQNVLVPFGIFLASAFKKAWEGITKVATWLWNNVLAPFGVFLLWFRDNVLVPISGVLKDMLGMAFKTVADIAKSFWQNVMIPLGNFFADNFQPAVEALSAVFNFFWNNVLVPLGTFISSVLKVEFEVLTKVITYLWEQVLEPLSEFVAGSFTTTFNTAFEGIGKAIDGLKTTLNGILTFITGVFTGDWEKAWTGVKNVFKGIFDTLYSVVKTPINLIIDAVNMLITGLNKIQFTIPDWVPEIGGNSYGINISKIPHLAQGGITNGPMLAMVGDNPGGREVVSPLGDLRDMIASAVGTAVMSAMQFSDGNKQSGDIILQIDGTTLARVIGPYNTKETVRIGGSLITVT